MAKVQHKDLPENQLHEPKGASIAPANSFLFARGDGTTGFRPIQNSDLAGLVTASVDVQLAMNTHANWGMVIGAIAGPVSGPKVWGTLGFSYSDAGVAAALSTDHITYIANSADNGQLLITTAGWYLFRGTFYVTRVTGTAMATAAVRFTVDDGSGHTPSIVSASTNNNQVAQLTTEDLVYLDEGQTVSYQYCVSNTGMTVTATNMSDAVPGSSFIDPTRGPVSGYDPLFVPCGVKAWRIG